MEPGLAARCILIVENKFTIAVAIAMKLGSA